MNTGDLPYQKIIFVCTNRRSDAERVCCAEGGACALRDRLKAMVKARRLNSRIRVSQSGCMDKCEEGPNIMIFPDNVWLSRVRAEDLETILDAVAESLDGGPQIPIQLGITRPDHS